MTLSKHTIDGLPDFEFQTISAEAFEQRMKAAGYTRAGSGKGKMNRVKVWWSHKQHRFVESIYSPDEKVVITAYHPDADV